MLLSSLSRFLLLCLLPAALAAEAADSGRRDIALPTLGAGGVMTLEEEYKIGRNWLRQFHKQTAPAAHPLLQDYLENLVLGLAEYSKLDDHRLEVLIIDNLSINAFAVPGGILGIHLGLLMHSATEDELASVITHELAHVSQRHFSRTLEQNKINSWPAIAGLLGGIILAASGAGSPAVLAAIYTGQAATLQNRLAYSRQYEQEADRIGIENLALAGYDPLAASSFFNKLLEATRYNQIYPEFLLTHPLTRNRIADTQRLAKSMDVKKANKHSSRYRFSLMRAEVDAMVRQNLYLRVRNYRISLEEDPENLEKRYGLVLGLIRMNELEEAQQQLKPLLQSYPNEKALILTQADLHGSAGNHEKAVALLKKYLSVVPDDYPIMVAYAQNLLQIGEIRKALSTFRSCARMRPMDREVWRMLSEMEGIASEALEFRLARAEYLILGGAFQLAEMQLLQALQIAAKKDTPAKGRIIQRLQDLQVLREEARKYS